MTAKNLRATLGPIVVGLVVAAAMTLAMRSDFAKKLELRLLDYRYIARERYPVRPVPVSPDIALVLVDEDTLDRIEDPESLWFPLYARLLGGLDQAGVKAVGIDAVMSYVDLEKFAAAGPALLAIKDRLVFIGYLSQDGRSGDARLVLPHKVLLALGQQNVGLANLTRDLDGIPRAQAVFPVPLNQEGYTSWSLFAPRLAEVYSGRLLDPQRGTFGDAPLPLMGPTDPRILINYPGSTDQVFPRYSFADVLGLVEKGNVAELKRRFAGKVVLIGPGSKASQDITETPFSAVAAPLVTRGLTQGSTGSSVLGIHVQASILNTLLTGAWLRVTEPWVDHAVLFVFCIVVALIVYRLHVLAGVLFSLAVGGLVALFSVLAFSAHGLVIETLPLLAAVPLLWGATYSYRYAAEEREKQFIRETFGRYVSSEVMEELLEDPGKLGLDVGERREITVLFADINGFTTVSESRAPEEVIRMLNAYFAEMTRIIFKHKGTIGKFVGDELMVFYGAPRPHATPEEAAVATGLEMVERLAELGRQDPNADDPATTLGFYRIKVGINTGRVIMGNIGSAERMDFTIIGDTVNLASRIMNMTKNLGGNILLSDTTYDRAKGMAGVEFVYRDEQDVRGRQSRIGIYEARPGGSPAGSQPPGQPNP